MFEARGANQLGSQSNQYWLDAKQDGWVDQHSLSKLDKMYQKVFQDMKVVYQSGKGKSFVRLLASPKDLCGSSE